MAVKKPTRFSYSRLNQMENCPFAYYLKYEQKHFPKDSALTMEYGNLCHYILETIGNCIKGGKEIPYEKLTEDFWNIELHTQENGKKKEDILGANLLAKKYPEAWVKPSRAGKTYAEKAKYFAAIGMYRLEWYMQDHPELEIVGCEVPFEFKYNDNYTFFGYIDRLLKVKGQNKYVIHDIKTKDKEFRKEDLATPLQFVIYVLSQQKVYGEDAEFECCYDLPFAGEDGVWQSALTKGGMKCGLTKIDKLFAKIENKEWKPSPSILCAWCPFSANNPDQPEDCKNLCCYYNLSTQDEFDTYHVKMEWKGMDKHFIQMKKFMKLQEIDEAIDDDDFEI